MNADLHSHSNKSDGLLAPADLVRRAHANGVELFALTDHDEISGIAEAQAEARVCGLRCVSGVEISVSWRGDHTIHLLGFDFDATDRALIDGLAGVRAGRDERARRMGAELDKVGIRGVYEGAQKYVSNPALISRLHFARYIAAAGHAKDVKSVFDYWLAKGKPGYVSHVWAELEQAVGWIRSAGGIAVMAHPGRYRVSRAEMRELTVEFMAAGGEGIEVLSSSHTPGQAREVLRLAREFKLLASCGSDFHGPGESWIDLGKMPPLPDDLTPVWSRFQISSKKSLATEDTEFTEKGKG
ncbi:3',5'-nucleoside bisphosphate phosphatase [Georgfuchsia toluolica]|uniref:3',5'-nucleoside bisphosphate phosphatase n=1 Tax=Georgfuchsia toluolica TaxID=424218 RepID=A0A916J1T5_9PROT|nr:3',5'-nucleoside bisphosphate phosphatase [Georgfuchsia toluolica]CAG4883012.1 3',5'-nucleoside bisphosphate phosphatase [Georgfuchsia toluolica]